MATSQRANPRQSAKQRFPSSRALRYLVDRAQDLRGLIVQHEMMIGQSDLLMYANRISWFDDCAGVSVSTVLSALADGSCVPLKSSRKSGLRTGRHVSFRILVI